METRLTMKRKILIKGAITSFIIALTGNLVFASIQEIYFISEIGWGDSSFGLIFMVGLGLIAIPSLLAGLLLSTILYDDYLQKRLKILTASLKGSALGLITSIGICSLVYVLINGRATFSIFLTYMFEAILLAVLCGAYVGKNLAEYIFKVKPNVQIG